MPNKRQFDMTVLVILLAFPVHGLYKMWATRVSADSNSGPVSKAVAGAVRLMS